MRKNRFKTIKGGLSCLDASGGSEVLHTFVAKGSAQVIMLVYHRESPGVVLMLEGDIQLVVVGAYHLITNLPGRRAT